MGCDGFAGYVRGAAPTAASVIAKTGDYQVMSYAATSAVRATMAYDVNSAHIYYPTGATAPFTAVVIVPGFTAAESSIANWAPFLASRGIIVMTIGTSNPSTGASDTSVLPPVREAALLDALTTIKGENTRSGSPLVGQVDVNRLATSGWSMGGGGTLLAANSTPSLKATMAMCPWNPSGTYPMDTVPTLMFGGTNDGLAGAPMPDDQYDSIPTSTPKMLYVINGGTHFVANDPAGESGKYDIGRIGLSWMKVFLECDTRYKQFLTKPTDASEFQTTVM
jgi:dienelactone hydrolase